MRTRTHRHTDGDGSLRVRTGYSADYGLEKGSSCSSVSSQAPLQGSWPVLPSMSHQEPLCNHVPTILEYELWSRLAWRNSLLRFHGVPFDIVEHWFPSGWCRQSSCSVKIFSVFGWKGNWLQADNLSDFDKWFFSEACFPKFWNEIIIFCGLNYKN